MKIRRWEILVLLVVILSVSVMAGNALAGGLYRFDLFWWLPGH